MDDLKASLGRVGTIVGYLLLGVVVTAGFTLATLYVTQPLQPVIYDVFYLQVGPTAATKTAILTHFLLAIVVGMTASYLLGDYASTRLANRPALTTLVLGLLGVLAVFLALAFVRLAAFLTAIVVLGVGVLALPVVLRYYHGVRSGGLPAFAGGIPVAVLALLLAGFGLGWGWGYIVTAQEVPDASATGDVASFEDAPAFEHDLFTNGYCREERGDRRTCSLELRGYEHELAATRFLARHGVRCPYEAGTISNDENSVIARHNDTYYRITCMPHGD